MKFKNNPISVFIYIQVKLLYLLKCYFQYFSYILEILSRFWF